MSSAFSFARLTTWAFLGELRVSRTSTAICKEQAEESEGHFLQETPSNLLLGQGDGFTQSACSGDDTKSAQMQPGYNLWKAAVWLA